MRPITVALIDGPLPWSHPALESRQDIREGVADSPAAAHALALAEAILAHAPAARLRNLVVFGTSLTTGAGTLAEALTAARDAEVALCALGIARADPGLAAEVAALQASGAVIVAAAPARGGAAWPASLPDVLSVQGDARCGPGEWSFLGLASALFGACPLAGHGVAGASAAAGHFAGHVAAALGRDVAPARLHETRQALAVHHGRERRGPAPRP
ncbi:MAG TPA: hypothetical protein VFR34_12295 [Paracoccaceae bacterium]|nr:hypothetical protein [Paracoccaceae bacterium]